jgi:hypothetical protein
VSEGQSRSASSKWIRNAVLIGCWPLLLLVLWATSSKGTNGQRWAEANEGRGTLLALTGALWMFAMFLWAIWWLTFSLLIPALQRRKKSDD